MKTRTKTIQTILVMTQVLSGIPLLASTESVFALTDNGPSFPLHNDVTMTIDGTDILFRGEDLTAKINKYYPEILDNQTALQVLSLYEDILMFVRESQNRAYVVMSGLNESHFVEVLFTFDDPYITDRQVSGIEVLSNKSYLDQMKVALKGVVDENVSRRLNITPEIAPFLWNYEYTETPLLREPNFVIFNNESITDLLNSTHWEFQGHAFTLLTFEQSWYQYVPIALSVAQDGKVIQMISYAPTTPPQWIGPPGPPVDIIALGGIGVCVALIIIIAMSKQKKG